MLADGSALRVFNSLITALRPFRIFLDHIPGFSILPLALWKIDNNSTKKIFNFSGPKFSISCSEIWGTVLTVRWIATSILENVLPEHLGIWARHVQSVYRSVPFAYHYKAHRTKTGTHALECPSSLFSYQTVIESERLIFLYYNCNKKVANGMRRTWVRGRTQFYCNALELWIHRLCAS